MGLGETETQSATASRETAERRLSAQNRRRVWLSRLSRRRAHRMPKDYVRRVLGTVIEAYGGAARHPFSKIMRNRLFLYSNSVREQKQPAWRRYSRMPREPDEFQASRADRLSAGTGPHPRRRTERRGERVEKMHRVIAKIVGRGLDQDMKEHRRRIDHQQAKPKQACDGQGRYLCMSEVWGVASMR